MGTKLVGGGSRVGAGWGTQCDITLLSGLKPARGRLGPCSRPIKGTDCNTQVAPAMDACQHLCRTSVLPISKSKSHVLSFPFVAVGNSVVMP